LVFSKGIVMSAHPRQAKGRSPAIYVLEKTRPQSRKSVTPHDTHGSLLLIFAEGNVASRKIMVPIGMPCKHAGPTHDSDGMRSCAERSCYSGHVRKTRAIGISTSALRQVPGSKKDHCRRDNAYWRSLPIF
jgi:hypothetical protein